MTRTSAHVDTSKEPSSSRAIRRVTSIETEIYQRHGLVSWNHQGTEERYRRLKRQADLSFVVGRASLQHFLDTQLTRVLNTP